MGVKIDSGPHIFKTHPSGIEWVHRTVCYHVLLERNKNWKSVLGSRWQSWRYNATLRPATKFFAVFLPCSYSCSLEISASVSILVHGDLDDLVDDQTECKPQCASTCYMVKSDHLFSVLCFKIYWLYSIYMHLFKKKLAVSFYLSSYAINKNAPLPIYVSLNLWKFFKMYFSSIYFQA